MAGSRCPGSLCSSKIPSIEDGTLVRTNSPLPGSVGRHHLDQTNIFEIVRTTGKARRINKSQVRAKYHGRISRPSFMARLTSFFAPGDWYPPCKKRSTKSMSLPAALHSSHSRFGGCNLTPDQWVRYSLMGTTQLSRKPSLNRLSRTRQLTRNKGWS